MKTNDILYSFKHDFTNLFHFKCSEVPILKEDYLTVEDFSEQINEPFEVYEKYLRAVEHEKRIAYISVETPTEEFSEPIEEGFLQGFDKVIVYKQFIGEYDDAMKLQIEEYMEEMGYSNKKRIENTIEHFPGYRYCPYSCSIYDMEHTLGFYFSRHGLLRNCFKEDFPGDEMDEWVGGNFRDFQKIEKYMDADYIKYVYGNEGWKRLHKYYTKHFLENFEYGRSVLFLT